MFNPASAVKPLTEEQCRALAVAAFRRILAAESKPSVFPLKGGRVSEGVSGRWGYPDMRQIYLVLWTFLFAFVMYRELLLLTRYMCKDRQGTR